MEFLGFDIYLVIVVAALLAMLLITWVAYKFVPKIVLKTQGKKQPEKIVRTIEQSNDENKITELESENYNSNSTNASTDNQEIPKRDQDSKPIKMFNAQVVPVPSASEKNEPVFKTTNILDKTPNKDKIAIKPEPENKTDMSDLFSDIDQESPVSDLASKIEDVDLETISNIGHDLFQVLPGGKRTKDLRTREN